MRRNRLSLIARSLRAQSAETIAGPCVLKRASASASGDLINVTTAWSALSRRWNRKDFAGSNSLCKSCSNCARPRAPRSCTACGYLPAPRHRADSEFKERARPVHYPTRVRKRFTRARKTVFAPPPRARTRPVRTIIVELSRLKWLKMHSSARRVTIFLLFLLSLPAP